MKITVHKDLIMKELETVKGITNSGRINNDEALSVILETVGSDKITIRTSNFEQFFHSEVVADVSEKGFVVVPALEFYNAIKFMDGNITIHTDGKKMTLENVKGDCKLSTFNIKKEEIVKFPDIDNVTFTSVCKSDFNDALLFASNSMAQNDARICLNGVHIGVEDNRLIFVGGNGKSLSVVKSYINGSDVDIVVPNKAVRLILSRLEKLDIQNINIAFTPEFMFYKYDNCWFATRLLCEKFSKIWNKLPCNFVTTLTVNRNDLKELITSIKFLLDNNSNKLYFSVNGNLKIVAQSDKGEAKRFLSAEINGNSVEFAFYYDQILKAIDSFTNEESVTFNVVSGDEVIRLTSSNVENSYIACNTAS